METKVNSGINEATVGDLVIMRIIDATPQQVWQAWTDPEYMKRWWGPKNFTAPVGKIDLREGGEYHFCMRSPDGDDFWSKGFYREIKAPERLVMTDSFADEQGNIVPASYYQMPGEWPMELLVTLALEDHDGRTKMTIRHQGLPEGEMKEQCAEGWNQSFDKLNALFQ